MAADHVYEDERRMINDAALCDLYASGLFIRIVLRKGAKIMHAFKERAGFPHRVDVESILDPPNMPFAECRASLRNLIHVRA